MKTRIFKLISLFAVVLLILTSCSKGSYSTNDGASKPMEDIFYDGMEMDKEEATMGSTSNSTIEVPDDNSRKIIETIELTVQTKGFDTLLDGLSKQITELGGYIESSNIYGREFDSTRNRSAYLKIRIPAEKTSSFTGYVSENSVVTNESINTKDVTLSYVDMESRVSALEAEKAALEKLLDNAETMNDIISIRDKLTDVIYEIESYKSQLRTYDNLISYSTVTVNIHEVERTVVVEEQTTWEQIGTNLKNNFENVWNGAVAVFIFAVSAIPYLIPVAVICGLVLVIISIRKKSRKRKTATNNENS